MYTNLGRNVEKLTGINGRMEGRKEGRKECHVPPITISSLPVLKMMSCQPRIWEKLNERPPRISDLHLLLNLK